MEEISFTWVNGRPRSGKDTCLDAYLEKNPSDEIYKGSTGDIFRGAIKGEGEFSIYHADVLPYLEQVNSGGLLPDEVIMNILKKVIMGKQKEGKSEFYFTGVPRTLYQLQILDDWMIELSTQGFEIEERHIGVHASDEVVRSRMGNAVEEALIRGEAPRRDDTLVVLGERLKIYQEVTEPMLNRLAGEGRLIVVNSHHPLKENVKNFEGSFGVRPSYPGQRK